MIEGQVTAIRHIPELDGVRGLAILLVVMCHLRIPGMSIGWCGVDLFFVLSGFLITSILLATKSSRDYFSAFYARRVLRIFPLYFAVLAAVFCMILPAMQGLGLAHSVRIQDQLWYWLYASNWFNALGHNVFYFTHFWSLAIEEQFYFIWPLLVFTLDAKWLARLCLALMVACPLLRVAFCLHNPSSLLIQRATFFRIDALASGALIALVAADPQMVERWKAYFRSAFYFSAAALAAIVMTNGTSFTVPMMTAGYLALSLTASYLVLFAVTHSGDSAVIPKTLRLAPLRKLGKYSYGLYVVHYPIIVCIFAAQARILAHHPSWNKTFAQTITLLFAALVCWVAALLSWSLLEKHFHRLKDKFGYLTSLDNLELPKSGSTADQNRSRIPTPAPART